MAMPAMRQWLSRGYRALPTPIPSCAWTPRATPRSINSPLQGRTLHLLRLHSSSVASGDSVIGGRQHTAGAAGALALTPWRRVASQAGPATPKAGSPQAPLDDAHFMALALREAQQAGLAGEVPIGAVLVAADGSVLATAHNESEGSGDPTAHAELLCIRRGAAAAGRGWRLLEATLYVTLEPCPMCAGAALQARVGAVVYGARNTLLGADGSWIAMLPPAPAGGREEGPLRGDSTGGGDSSSSGGSSEGLPSVSGRYGEQGREGGPPGRDAAAAAARPARPHPFNPQMAVRRGVLEGECSDLMRQFFRQRRLQSKELENTAQM